MTHSTGSSTPPGLLRPRLLILLLVVAGLAAVVGILVPAGTGWDFANFYDTGRRVAAGQLSDIYDPTTLIGGAAPQGQMRFWGTPASAWFYAPLSLLSPGAALIAFKLVGTVAFATGLVILFREVVHTYRGEVADTWYPVAFLLLVLACQPYWSIYRVGGQTTPLAFLLLVLGLAAYVRGRDLATVLCLLIAVLIKPAFGFVPLVLMVVSGWRFLRMAVAVFALAGLGSLVLFGWPIHAEFLSIVREGAGRPTPWVFNSSLYILGDAFRQMEGSVPVPGTGGILPGAINVALRVAVVLVCGRLLWRVRNSGTPAGARLVRYLGAVSFGILFSTVVWEHYLTLLMIPLPFLLADAMRGDPPFAVRVRVHLGVIAGLLVFQNLILVLFFLEHVQLGSTADLLGVSLIKAGPLLAYLLFLFAHHARFDHLQALRPEVAHA